MILESTWSLGSLPSLPVQANDFPDECSLKVVGFKKKLLLIGESPT